jgi:SAM-dependent methyltransferase
MNKTCAGCSAAVDTARKIGQKDGYDFLRCDGCGTVTVSPYPTKEQLTDYYQSYHGTKKYVAKAQKKIARSRKRVARLMRYTDGKRFLDVGCNYGLAVKAALDLGLNAAGIDIDADTIKIGNEMLGSESLKAISVSEYAAQGHQADIVYTSEVIEHVHSPEKFIEAIAKILSPGGVLYLTTPQAGHWLVPKDFAQYKEACPPRHINYFSKKGIRNLLQRHGFQKISFDLALKPGIRLIAQKS